MKAVIVGVSGQDGRLLKSYLTDKGFEVTGITSEYLIFSDEAKSSFSIVDKQAVENLVLNEKPAQIYYLAGFHHSSEEIIPVTGILEKSYNVHVLGLINFLDAIKNVSPHTRLFYAGSSLMFGNPDVELVTENTKFMPDCIYGITKLTGYHLVRYYRNTHNIFASTGILFNHESPLRGEKFLSKKVIKAAVEIKMNKRNELIIGDLSAKTDWGYAPDYVDAMYRILTANVADDFIIATGQLHSVSELVEEVFSYLELDYKKYVKEDKRLLKRRKPEFSGSNKKIFERLGWQPATDFKEMIKILVDAELKKRNHG